ncbi:MAG TPA: fumarate hydratase [Firmicutes bacterium]|jgi:fumarate hydratase subunit alpha|nr:fumarate hydratase [Bacillota bacterium]HOQ23147.1 fumarate hydratase [Bacillota bacterium]HPT66576.1 fumarate hydratase [Bacillota bacterium]
MREIAAEEITRVVAELCQEANFYLGEDLIAALKDGLAQELSPVGQECLRCLLDNAELAREERMPVCQDTGMAVVFADLGQEAMVVGADFNQAIEEGVRRGYREGYLRKSVVNDPLDRVNTGDNTPPVVHLRIVPGDRLTLTVAPKGFGSENMSALKMLTPAQGVEGVKRFILDTVLQAGGNPCPPVVVGVGIGGTMEMAAILAKRALLRPVGSSHANPFYAGMERELLAAINQSGIGPQGLGGRITALGVNIETYPTHIAGLPVAVNISCHVTRHRSRTL